jgi:NAD+ dependent glucose-6-phosphate dehydrogenase
MDDPVLLTGAGGHVGQAILDGLSDAYDWRLLDRRPLEDEFDHPFRVADVTDHAAVAAAMDGTGAVIHLAADPRPDAPWDSVLPNNIDGTQTVFQAAVEQGVEKVIFASSNHAVGHYETDRKPAVYQEEGDLALDGTELPRPSNLYGVSKAAGEVLGRFYHDEYGLSVVCVRVGNLQAHHPPADYERGQAMWLSHRDCTHLFDRCLKAEYGYEIVYGVSDNTNSFYDLSRAREVLGYQPKDDSSVYE